MRIGAWLMAEFTGADDGGFEVDNTGDALRVLLVESDGNVSQLARDLGRSRRTVRNWLSGTTPKGGGGWLMRAAREALTGGRLDELRNGFETVTIGGSLTMSPPNSEPRTLEFSFTPGFGDDLVDAYLNGATADELESLFVAQIGDDWYRDHVGDPDSWDTDWIEP